MGKWKQAGESADIQPGDRVRIRAGWTGSVDFCGRVINARDYGMGDAHNWHIEVVDDDGRYHYVKQFVDSADVEKINR